MYALEGASAMLGLDFKTAFVDECATQLAANGGTAPAVPGEDWDTSGGWEDPEVDGSGIYTTTDPTEECAIMNFPLGITTTECCDYLNGEALTGILAGMEAST